MRCAEEGGARRLAQFSSVCAYIIRSAAWCPGPLLLRNPRRPRRRLLLRLSRCFVTSELER
eukprot:646017-Lingulodinium_polyedra.AAC.1